MSTPENRATGPRDDITLDDAHRESVTPGQTSPGGSPAETGRQSVPDLLHPTLAPPQDEVPRAFNETIPPSESAGALRSEQLRRVGDYEVLEELGRGGMGVVYKARQKSLNRVVALKMVLAGGQASSSELQRFKVEAEAVARLHHPNIVQIYEVGEHDGRPYASLEFVPGGTLADHLRLHKPSPREAAELMHTLAGAMASAHHAGIVHRDLKPANVLLAARGTNAGPQAVTPKITDFGLAKHLETDSSQTREGSILGTPSYMAPEQAEGRVKEVGPGADIYALGAILYEMLCGIPPFRGETVHETLWHVVHKEPAVPRQLRPGVPADLQTICLKCLEKSVGRRYGTADELAADLRRFQNREPIHARPASALERVWKWARRRPAAAGALALSILTPLLIAAAGLIYARRERELRQFAEENRRDAERQRERAETNLQDARAALHYLTTLGHSRLALYPRLEPLRREILNQVLALHQRFVATNAEDDQQRWHVARAQLHVGEIQEMLGQHALALAARQSSIDVLTPLVARFPDRAEYRRDLAAAWNDLALLHHTEGRYDEADSAFARALDLKHALALETGSPEDRGALARSYSNRGQLRLSRKQLSEATEDHLEALRLLGTVAQGEEDRARVLVSLASVWTARGERARAEKTFAEALTVWDRLARQHPDEPRYRQRQAETHLNCGTLHHVGGKTADAEKDYRLAARLLSGLAEKFPDILDYRHQLAETNSNLGQLLREQNRGREAAEVWAMTVQVLGAIVSEFPDRAVHRQKLGLAHNERAIALVLSGRNRDAIAEWDAGIKVQQKLVADFAQEGQYWKELLESQENLTRLLMALRLGPEAEAACRDWISSEERRAAQFRDRADVVQEWSVACGVMAEFLKDHGRTEESSRWSREATSIARRAATRTPR